ncbi:MAG TPA: hypothetical protein PL110_21015 [Candidatus Eremiobacteraeota bacterium]|nr:hypothetical protein [Candidatus Eremiobacteraeota bacterium]
MKKYSLFATLFILMFLMVYYMPGCGDDTVVTTPVPTATRTPSPTAVPTTPAPTAVPTATLTPTPTGNLNLEAEFDYVNAGAYMNTILPPRAGRTGVASLIIQIRQKSSSTYVIKDIELINTENPGLQYYNALCAAGPSGWEALSSLSAFIWTGETQLTKAYTWTFEVNYAMLPASFPKKLRLTITGGDNHQKLGYVDIAIINATSPSGPTGNGSPGP